MEKTFKEQLLMYIKEFDNVTNVKFDKIKFKKHFDIKNDKIANAIMNFSLNEKYNIFTSYLINDKCESNRKIFDKGSALKEIKYLLINVYFLSTKDINTLDSIANSISTSLNIQNNLDEAKYIRDLNKLFEKKKFKNYKYKKDAILDGLVFEETIVDEKINSTELTIFDYIGKEEFLVLPRTIENKAVRNVEEDVLENLKAISIPSFAFFNISFPFRNVRLIKTGYLTNLTIVSFQANLTTYIYANGFPFITTNLKVSKNYLEDWNVTEESKRQRPIPLEYWKDVKKESKRQRPIRVKVFADSFKFITFISSLYLLSIIFSGTALGSISALLIFVLFGFFILNFIMHRRFKSDLFDRNQYYVQYDYSNAYLVLAAFVLFFSISLFI